MGARDLETWEYFMYGFVGVLGAILSGNQHAWTNAFGVQIFVIAAWIYPSQKQDSKILSLNRTKV